MAVATSHNGGTLQANSWPLLYNGEFPFINLMKTCQTWDREGTVNGPPAPDTLDENGYPTTLDGAVSLRTVFAIPSQTNRPGNQVIKWDGTGTIELSLPNIAFVEGTFASRSGNSFTSTDGGRVVVSCADNADEVAAGTMNANLKITATDSVNNVRNIAWVHEDDEALYDAGEIVSPLFKQRIIEGGIGVYRDLDLGYKNGSQCTTWATRKPVDYYSYEAQELRASIYAGVTTGSGGAYAVTMSGFSYVQGATIQFMPNHTSANLSSTLSVNGTSKPLCLPWGAPFTGGYEVALPQQNRLRTAVYDADLDCWLMNYDAFGTGLINGTPPEIFLRLCAEIGCHPWFVQPPLSADPGTDYMASNAQMVKDYCEDNGITWMVPRFEGPNETWNFIFTGTQYAYNKANARWGVSQDHRNWYGRAVSVMGQAISTVYGDDRSKYWCICGMWTPVTDFDQPTVRLESPLHVADTSAAQAAKNWVTHICVANYWNVELEGATNEARMDWEVDVALAWDAATGEEKDAILTDYTSRTIDFLNGQFTDWMEYFADIAQTYGLGMTFYEGNYSPDYYGTDDPSYAERNALRRASKDHPVVYYAFHLSYAICERVGGVFPSIYNLGGKDGAWSVLDPTIYAADTPAWQAITAWKQGKRRFRAS